MTKSKAYKAYVNRKGAGALEFGAWLTLSKRLDAARAARSNKPAQVIAQPAAQDFVRVGHRIDVIDGMDGVIRLSVDTADLKAIGKIVRLTVVQNYTSKRGPRSVVVAEAGKVELHKLSKKFTVKGTHKLAA